MEYYPTIFFIAMHHILRLLIRNLVVQVGRFYQRDIDASAAHPKIKFSGLYFVYYPREFSFAMHYILRLLTRNLVSRLGSFF